MRNSTSKTPGISAVPSLDRLAKAMGLLHGEAAKPSETVTTYGVVKEVNTDGSYEVALSEDPEFTQCTKLCEAEVDDVVYVSILSNGKCVAVGKVGGDRMSSEVKEGIGSSLKDVYEEYAVSDSWEEAPEEGWSSKTPVWNDGEYVWRRIVGVCSNGSTQTGSPFCISAASGKSAYELAVEGGFEGTEAEWLASLVGKDGADGLPGGKGEDGLTSYVHVAYASDASGAGFRTAWFEGASYMGTCSSFEERDPEDLGEYSWARIKGESAYQVAVADGFEGTEAEWLESLVGKDGDDGEPGEPGADGKTPYLHIAYGTSPSGGDFSTAYFEGATHIGTCTDFVQDDPADAASYAWALIKGAKGDKGDKGDAGADGLTAKRNFTGRYAVGASVSSTWAEDLTREPAVGDVFSTLCANRYYTTFEVQSVSGEAYTVLSVYEYDLVGPQGADGAQGGGWFRVDTDYGEETTSIPVGKLYPSDVMAQVGDTVIYKNGRIGSVTAVGSAYYTVVLRGASLQGPQGDTGPQGEAGTGVKRIDTHVRQFTTDLWQTYGEAGHSEHWTTGAEYDNSHIKVGDTAYVSGVITDVVDANGANPGAAIYGVVTQVNGTSGIYMTSSYLVMSGAKGDKGETGMVGLACTRGFNSGTAVGSSRTNSLSDFNRTPVVGETFGTVDSSTYYIIFRVTSVSGDTVTSEAVYRYTIKGATGPAGETGPQGPTGAAGKDGQMLYAVCATAGGAAGKVASLVGGTLALNAGATVAVMFAEANTATHPTLNVGGTGAKEVYTNGVPYAYWEAGATVVFTYTGTYWYVASTPVYASTATVGNPAGGNVYIDSDSVDVRKGSEVLASFGETAVIGKASGRRVIIGTDSVKFANAEGGGMEISDSEYGSAIFGSTENYPTISMGLRGLSLMGTNAPEAYRSELELGTDGTISMWADQAERPTFNGVGLALMTDVTGTVSGFVPLSGGTMTGALKAPYVWVTSAANQGSAAERIAILSDTGSIRYRTPAEILSDIAALGTAGGSMAGDVIMAADAFYKFASGAGMRGNSSGALVLNGIGDQGVYLRPNASKNDKGVVVKTAGVLPEADGAMALGADAARWQAIYGREYYFDNADASYSSAYKFGMYQWQDNFTFVTRNAANNHLKDAWQIAGSTGVTNFLVRPTLNGAGLATQSELPTVPTNVSAFSNDAGYATTAAMNAALGKKANDYTIELYNGTGGNPKPVRFASVSYSTCNSENGVAARIGMVSGHGNGTSYAFLQDAIIRVNSSGSVEVDNLKYYGAATGAYDGAERQYGDIFWLTDATNKIVDFYVLMGQYARLYQTPWKRLTYSTGGSVTQHTSCTVYSSGAKTWANNSEIAMAGDIPKNVGAFSNDAGYLTEHQSLAGYATESWVNGKGYLTSVPSGYVTDSDLEAKGYLTAVPSEYVTEQALAAKGFLTSLPYRLNSYQSDAVADPNSAVETGFYYVNGSTNRPPFSQSANTDYRVLTTAYSDQWLQQIATDFRCTDVFVRRRQQGTWTDWKRLAYAEELPSLSDYARLSTANVYNGEQKFQNSQYCPTVADTASGVGCAFKASRGMVNELLADKLIMTAFTGRLPVYAYSATGDGQMTDLTEVAYFTKEGALVLDGAAVASKLTVETNGAYVKGRYVGAGDDEGLIIDKADNGYAGLILGLPAGARSVFYLMPDNSAVWRWNDGSASHDIKHPGKAGTIALTGDIPSLSGYATQEWVAGQLAGGVDLSGYATQEWVNGQGFLKSLPSHDHDGAYAKLATYNNLLHDNNEFTFVPDAYSGDVFMNYRTGAGNTNGNIGNYRFCNGKGGTTGVTLHADAFAGKAATAVTADKAVADGNGNNIASTYLPKSGGTMAGPLVLAGGDAASGVGNMQLDADGQITAKGTTATLFGRNGASTLLVGHSSHSLGLRGSASRPTYNGANVALTSDIPDLRTYTTMVPHGTQIEANSDLNAVDFFKVGNYYCRTDANTQTLSNCPTTWAFMMQVYSPLSTTVDNETTSAWVYRVRKLMDYFGNEYIQQVYSGGTANVWNCGPWRKIARASDIPTLTTAGSVLYSNASGTSGTVTLSASAANYSFLEVVFQDDGGRRKTVRIHEPNGKSAVIDRSIFGDPIMYTASTVLAVNGTAITQSNKGSARLADSEQKAGAVENVLKVVAVVGWA